MNALFARAPQHSSAALSSTPSTITIDTAIDRPLGLLDRMSLRLGLWLLTRHADRAQALDHRAAVAHRARRARAERLERERAWQRTAALTRLPF
ncbi:hypothetical protein [Microbacterium sp. VKM Ac-2923]|uniref:hypothetical protein n=1 Tax=Microbacterium sp. VKM Ac-2923 TaxID=2929476 RepID=UPI001FB394A7|nr:hypothetical protein [Microbacterium sp. VKM Ac-2923]MCJ1706698.1 hypothetical protein [Microbacterium sp. VKM Ac-2923]